MTFLGGVQGSHLPGQIVIPGSRCQLVEAHRHSHPKGYKPPGRSGQPEPTPGVHEVCGTSDFEIGWGYVKQAESVVMTAGVVGCAIWPCSGVVDEEMVMSQQSVRQAARRSALDAQAVLRKARAGRDRRLEGLAVAVLTALGERTLQSGARKGVPGRRWWQ
jgi:hypothetical protein